MSQLSEKLFRALDRAMKGKTFQSKEELNAFLEQFKGVNIDQLAASQAMTPEDEAMERVDAAMEAATREEAGGLLREALRLDPRCCEARVQLAHIESRSSVDLLPRLEAAIADEEARLGKAFFVENKGHFWGVHETRPYMRACLSRAWSLLDLGRLEEAQKAVRAMILLNPRDNQGARMILGPLCLRRGDLKAYRALRNKFKRADDLELLWGDVLEAFLLGDPDLALSMKAPARKANGHMEAYLLGHKRLPKRMPPSYSFGTPEEAACAALNLIPAWSAHPQALAWLARTR